MADQRTPIRFEFHSPDTDQPAPAPAWGSSSQQSGGPAPSDSGSNKKLTPKYELTLNGSAPPAEIIQSVIAITVRLDTDLSDAIEIRLKDDDLAWLDGDTVSEGTKIEVKLGYVESDSFDVIASGVVV